MTKKLNLCLVDDEDLIRITMEDAFADLGYNVVSFGNPLEALEYIKNNEIHIVITDVKMPELSGIELLKKVKKINPYIEVILITAFATVDSAVEAMKIGAFDYLTKPFQTKELIAKVEKLEKVVDLKKSNLNFEKHFIGKYNINSYLGKSAAVKAIHESIEIVADSDTTVLITGETGTGKELVANIIHYSSNRGVKPLIKVSCAILSREIFESELFGHVKGAFTGADKDRIGRFEEADGGTIYLDDIDDVPLDMQVKLLRVLQENEIERVGSNKPIKIDVRVIASTKKDLRKLCDEGKFREDLFYRLNVFPIHLPPLRERKEDIPVLFDYFVNEYRGKLQYSTEVNKLLLEYNWPGNTRELKNFAERCALLCKEGSIELKHLPPEMKSNVVEVPNLSTDENLPNLLTKIEIESIKNALAKTNGNKKKAAELLGIPFSTLRSKLEKYNIS